LLERRDKDISLIKYLSNVSCLYELEKDDFFALENKNEIPRLAKSLMERLLNEKVLQQKKCKEKTM
jgi:hypothetical protein